MTKHLWFLMTLFSGQTTFGQTTELCHTQTNKEFLKTELKSLTDTYKTVLADCNAQSPTQSRNDCEDDLSRLKQNIEKLTAMNTLAETLGCNYIFSRDDKPCTGGKYCQSYKIEEQTQSVNSSNITTEDVKNKYDLELRKIKAQNRQEFFELIFKIIGLFLENSDNKGIIGEIKKLIAGENSANERYTLLSENQSYIDTDGKRLGFKTTDANGSTSFAIDTDNDGQADHLTTYDKSGKVLSEKPLLKKRTSGVPATTKVTVNSNIGTTQNPRLFNFYSDCITTLNVKGFKAVCHDWEKPDNEFLYIIGATVKDCGESDWNWISPTGDIGLRVLVDNPNGKRLLKGRLFGPCHEKDEKNDPDKYEWLDYCSMRYNNFAIADLSENTGDKIYILSQEGDDWERGQGPDDNIFIATVSVEAIRQGNIAVTGTCDIPGKCATLYFAIGKYSKNQGIFWDKNLPSNIPSVTSRTTKSILKGVATAPLHPVRTVKDAAKFSWFVSKVTLSYIYDASKYIWDGPKKIIGAMNKKWVVIEYADGFCIFNHVRGYRTMEEIVNTATGKGGDCDWWPWPEGSKHVCLDTKKNAEAMVTKHGPIKDIKWIDHPTKNCGR